VLAGAVLAELYPSSASIRGADDRESLDRQRKCLRDIEAAVTGAMPATGKDVTAGELLSALDLEFAEAAEKLGAALNPRLQRLLGLRKEFTTHWKQSHYVRGLVEMAREAGIETDGFPSVHALVTSLEEERQLDFARVEEERTELIQRIVEHSDAAADPRTARALDEWVEASPVPEGTVLAPNEVISDPAWFGRLVALSKAYASQRMTMADYMRPSRAVSTRWASRSGRAVRLAATSGTSPWPKGSTRTTCWSATCPGCSVAFYGQAAADWDLDLERSIWIGDQPRSMGFHAPSEAARILAEAIDLARQGQVGAEAYAR
jgi:hypothetical protein